MRGQTVEYAPVGNTLENGFDLGGARVYPFSTGLAISPPSMYGSYIGSGMGSMETPPVSALSTTAGEPHGSMGVQAAMANPFSLKASPLPWAVGGVVVAIAAMYLLHYK